MAGSGVTCGRSAEATPSASSVAIRTRPTRWHIPPTAKYSPWPGMIQDFVEIWDVPGRKRIATLQPKEGHLVAFSPHGDLLATDAGNQIRLWRTGTWDLVAPTHPSWLRRVPQVLA